MVKIMGNERFKKVRAKFDAIGSCSHIILAGETIGYDPATKKTRCAVCFSNIRERDGKREQESMNRNLRVD